MNHRLLSGPALLLCVIALLTFWLDRAIQQPRFREYDGLNHQPDYIIENLTGIQVNYDRAVQHIFTADMLTHFPVGDTAYLEQVNFTRLKPDEPLVQVIADRAELSGGGDDIYLTGNVFITRERDTEEDKVTVATQFIHLIPDVEIAKTDQFVTVTRRNTIVNAVGMELNHRTGEIQLKSNVKASDDKTRQNADRPANQK